VSSSINGMRIAGFVLAIATCCGASEVSAQLFLNIGGGNAPAPGSAGLGTGGPGTSGIVSSPGNPAELRLGGVGSSRWLSIPLLNQGAGNAMGVTGNAAGTARGSPSSAMDRPSSPVDSVTNTLMGSVSNAVSRETNSVTNTAGKRKQNSNAGTTSSSGRGATAASKISPAAGP
jgi:hypothetical protein